MFGSFLLFISLCQGKGSLGWPQAEIAHSALLYEVSDSIGIRSEFPARAEAMFTPERGKEAVGAIARHTTVENSK